MKNPDTLYADALNRIADFRFDERVADVFDDMIERSVPGYRSIIAQTETLTERYARPGTNLYDLGCSLGASALAMLRGLRADGCRVVAVDSSAAMIERCRKNLAPFRGRAELELRREDLLETPVENASVVVLNFTLQFVPPNDRDALLRRIAAGMVPGGVLILSEKVAFADPTHHELMIELHHEFKRTRGYSDLEIAQKRTALETVLIPETLPAHRERLLNAGFASCDVWFQCFNFASLLAVR